MVDGGRGEEDPIVEVVEGCMVVLLCFRAETAPEIGFEGGGFDREVEQPEEVFGPCFGGGVA
jgi:hypothetical protein